MRNPAATGSRVPATESIFRRLALRADAHAAAGADPRTRTAALVIAGAIAIIAATIAIFRSVAVARCIVVIASAILRPVVTLRQRRRCRRHHKCRREDEFLHIRSPFLVTDDNGTAA